MTCKLLTFGAGGHFCVVAEIAELMAQNGDDLELLGTLVSDHKGEQTLPNYTIWKQEDMDSVIAEEGVTHFHIAIGFVKGVNQLRGELFDLARSKGLEPKTLIHPTATLAVNTQIDEGVLISANVTLMPNVKIGKNVIVNTGAIIDHDGAIGDDCHIAPGVVLSGDVSVGVRSLVGTGAVVKQGIKIGEDCTIGAGAVVVRDVENGVTVVGNPARIVE